MIVLVVLAIVFGIVMTVLQVMNLNELKAEIEEEELALQQAQALLNRRLQYKANESLYREQLRVYSLLIPEEAGQEDILRYFEYLADEYDIDLVDLRFDNRVVSSEQGFIRMPMVVNVEGRYQNMIGFLDHLYLGDRAVRVDTIRITQISGQVPNIRVVINANAFHII